MSVVLKLGGSVVTEKDQREQVDREALARVCHAIARDRPDRLVIVHGGGSFGHPVAAEYGVDGATPTRDVAAIAEIANAMSRLNRIVVRALVDADVPAIGLQTGAFARRRGDGNIAIDGGTVEAILEEGFVPVVRGDIALVEGSGAAVLSGDDLTTALAGTIDADRIGVCADVPGIFDEDGAVIEHVASFEAVENVIAAPEGTDVTGGMARKIHALLETDTPAAVFDADGLATFLSGGWPGTRIGGDAGSF